MRMKWTPSTISYCHSMDGNIPSLLSMPYIGSVKRDDELYVNTRRFILSKENPYYCIGTAGEGPGGPHVGMNMIWPLGLITQALTSTDDAEISRCLEDPPKHHRRHGLHARIIQQR